MIPEKYRLKNTIKYPTSVIIGGLNKLGLEIADSLIEQGGYVIIVDTYSQDAETKLGVFPANSLISFLDYTAIPHLDEDIRRLDYVFYFHHESEDLNKKISTSEFLNLSNYLDSALDLAQKFNAKFLLTTSIKAHQLVISKQDVNLEYGYGISSSKHTVYTEMELQKYAESLAMEYFEKEKLDLRIIRLGELIGDGIDFNKETPFTQILMDAVTNNQIRLRKDGLDSEWYIHILDAAYGIIKAQFSRITSGEIYSLTYETPFTNLSVAYKVQEYDSDAREIVFLDESDNLPPLKLYKPAPNLSTIGWGPKVSFEKAVKQSLAAAKIFVLETQSPIKKSNGTLVDKIKGFLALAETESSVSSEAGAISRLIAERKRQEELKKQSISYASNTLKTKRRRQKTLKEKIEDGLWTFFRSLGESFNIFKNKSPAQITGIILLIFIFLIVYLNYISPVVVIARNLLIIYPEVSSLEANIQTGNYKAVKSNLDTLDFHFEDTKRIILKFESLAGILALDSQFNELERNLDAYSEFIDGAKNLSIGIEPFNSYLDILQNNTVLRAATDSYISLSNLGVDYSQYFNRLKTSLPYVENGLSKIQKSAGIIKSIKSDLIPGLFANNLFPINNKIVSMSEFTKDMNTAKYLPSLFGVDSTKTYLVLILDNGIPAPLGGAISSYGLITVDKGSLVEVIVQSVDDGNFKFNSLSESDVQKINLRRLGFKNKSNLEFKDLASLKNIDDFVTIAAKSIKDTYSRDISGVATININSLNTLLSLINNNTGKTTQINSVEFGNKDLLTQIDLAQGDNRSLRNRNSVIAQVSAFVINNIIDVYKSNPAEVVKVLNLSAQSKDILVSTKGLTYQDYVISKDLNQSKVFNTTLPIDISFSVSDPKYLGSNKLPSYTTAIESLINSDFTIDNKINFKFPNLASTVEISLCLPANIADSSINVDNIPTERYVKTSIDQQKCTNIQAISEDEVSLSWKTTQLGKVVGEDLREVSYGIAKILGGTNTLDMKVSVDPTLSVVSFVPDVGQVSNSFIFTSQLKDDLLSTIVLKR